MQTIGIIGAGITGLTTAQLTHNNYEVTVFEQGKKGGLIRCERTKEGYLYHLVGGHVFNSKNKDVLNWFWSHFDKDTEFTKAKRNAKIWINNQYIGYPIENHLAELPKDLAQSIIRELLEVHRKEPLHTSFKEIVSAYSDFEDFLIRNFGPTLFKVYFEPYNKKIWKKPLSKITLEWLEGKLPMPNIEEVMLLNILKAEETEMVHSNFYYPRKNGSQFIIDRLSEHINIQENNSIEQIEIADAKIRLNHNFLCDKLIYTGDIRELPRLLKGSIIESLIAPFIPDLNKLQANGTTNVLCTTNTTDCSWLYLPDANYMAHRIIYTGNFSDSNNVNLLRKSCVVEFSGQVSEHEAFATIKQLPEELTPIKLHYKKASYIIQDKHTRSLIANIKKVLAPYSIFLLGRFAEWEYYNMDKCIEAAMTLNKEFGLED